MKTHFTGLALATLLTIGSSFPGYTEDAAPPATATPPAAQNQTPPPSVPRPSLAPKAAEPKAAEPASSPVAESAQRPHRGYARRHGRYGYYRTAYWEPFPIYWPHYYHHRVHWGRIPWFFRF